MLSTTLRTSPCQVLSKEAIVKLGYMQYRKKKKMSPIPVSPSTYHFHLALCLHLFLVLTYYYNIVCNKKQQQFCFSSAAQIFHGPLDSISKAKKKLLQKRSQSISAFLQQMRGKEASQDSVADHIKKCLKAKAFFGIH